MKHYYIDSYVGWFVVEASTAKKARSEGVKEFGRGWVRGVRLATKEEVKEFVRLKGEDALRGDELPTTPARRHFPRPPQSKQKWGVCYTAEGPSTCGKIKSLTPDSVTVTGTKGWGSCFWQPEYVLVVETEDEARGIVEEHKRFLNLISDPR